MNNSCKSAELRILKIKSGKTYREIAYACEISIQKVIRMLLDYQQVPDELYKKIKTLLTGGDVQ